jgi:predicted nucleotidyltransferase
MTPQVAALLEIARYLDARKVPYATIGGIAAAVWGRPRATQDADLTVLVPPEQERSFLDDLVRSFPGRISDAAGFATTSRVALLAASNGVALDVVLGIPGYQEEMLRRARDVELELGATVRVCSPEDLIVHKAVAGRGQDRQDILAVLERRFTDLDVTYIRNWLAEFDAALGTPDSTRTFELALADHSRGTTR